MPERHVSQSAFGQAQPIPPAPRVEPQAYGSTASTSNAQMRAAVHAGRQAVVIDQVMRPPVPVAPDAALASRRIRRYWQHANGGAGAAMPAPVTPAAPPPNARP